MARLEGKDQGPDVEYIRMFDNGGRMQKDGTVSFRNMSSNTTPCAPEDAPETYTAE